MSVDSSSPKLLIFVIFRVGTPASERFSIHHEYYFDENENPTVLDLYHAARCNMLLHGRDLKPRLDVDTPLTSISDHTFQYQEWTSEYAYEEAKIRNHFFGKPRFINRPHLKELRGTYPGREDMKAFHVPEMLHCISHFDSLPLTFSFDKYR